ncbi:Neuropeptide FF receptor 1 [Trichoplax sp. H2]|nr:Neuropeptide FF receptor 1 [Trichoplax sp. H2]|eukprot:RDD42145.1 Neuropeptide FF receptor 1 [Trichoplax sp. H2]
MLNYSNTTLPPAWNQYRNLLSPQNLTTLEVTFIVIYAILGFFGLINNAAIILIVTFGKHLRSPNNFLVVNLAVAGLIMSIFHVPWLIITQFIANNIWIFGPVMCKLYYTVTLLSIHLISFTQVAICISRYQGLNLIFKFQLKLTKKKVIIVITTIWIAALLMCLPYLIYLTVIRSPHTNQTHCMLSLPFTPYDFYIQGQFVSFPYFMYAICYLIVAYIIPFCTMAVLYSLIIRSLCKKRFNNFHTSLEERLKKQVLSGVTVSRNQKQRIIKVFLTSVVVFFISNLPSATSLFLFIVHSIRREIFISMRHYLATAQIFGIVSNAIIYGYFNTGIRRRSSKLLRRLSVPGLKLDRIEEINGQSNPKLSIDQGLAYIKKDATREFIIAS